MSLERSPFFEDMLLTVGDWSFQIWKEGETSPLFQSGYAAEYYSCGERPRPGGDEVLSTTWHGCSYLMPTLPGCWSPTRPAVVYVADNSGNLQV